MNLITQTYDADVYQLVPKVATNAMFEALLERAPTGDDDNPEWLLMDFRNDYVAMLAAAPQPETISPWRGIESAPKDGTPFYLTGFNYGNPSAGRWYDFGYMNRKGAIHSTINEAVLGFATHWMPLPQSPETK